MRELFLRVLDLFGVHKHLYHPVGGWGCANYVCRCGRQPFPPAGG